MLEKNATLIRQALATGIQAVQEGDKALARQLLRKVTEMDPEREQAWLWLAGASETPQEAAEYLQTVLALNPNNQQARVGLRWVQSREHSARHKEERKEQGPAEDVLPPAARELAPSFVLSVEQAEAVDAYLERMAYESDARCIILADMSGQLIAEWGQTERMNTQVLSAVAAGELAATQELARLVGEEARFKLLLHEGEEQSVYLSDIGTQLILVIVFDVSTPIGLVRIALKNAVAELMPLLAQWNQPHAAPQRTEIQETLNTDFVQLLQSELDVYLTAPDTDGQRLLHH